MSAPAVTARHAPQLRAAPVGGHLPAFARDPLGFLDAAARERAPVVRLRFARSPAWLLTDAALIDEVLVAQRHHFIKAAPLRAQRDLLGNGLLTNEGDAWLRQRRLAQPAFHRERVASYGATMVHETTRMVEGWSEGEARDVYAELKRLTMTIAARTMFGAALAPDAQRLAEAVDEAMARYAARRGLARLVPPWVPTAVHRRGRASIRQLDAVVLDLVRRRRAAVDDAADAADADDLLSMLLRARDEAGGGMDDGQLRDEITTFFVGGFDTPSLALTWGWTLLAFHPEAAERLAAEVCTTLGGRPAGAADVPRLRYTEAVVKEAMRLYPPAWLLSREATADVCLGGHFPIAAGAMVLMSPWVMHRDARVFDRPEAFRPERWLDGALDGLPRCAYFPFGAGPRVCIGAPFAMLEAVLVLATLAQRLRFTRPAPEAITPWPTMTLRPRSAVHVVVRRRAS